MQCSAAVVCAGRTAAAGAAARWKRQGNCWGGSAHASRCCASCHACVPLYGCTFWGADSVHGGRTQSEPAHHQASIASPRALACTRHEQMSAIRAA